MDTIVCSALQQNFSTVHSGLAVGVSSKDDSLYSIFHYIENHENKIKNHSFGATKSPSSYPKLSLSCLFAYSQSSSHSKSGSPMRTTSVELYQLLTFTYHILSLSDIPHLHPQSQHIHI